LFRFLRETTTQSNTLALYTRNFNKVTKIFIAKTQQEVFSQTIVSSSEVIYIREIKINYFECFKLIKQKTINKINKFRQAIEVIYRVLTIQYKREIIDDNIQAIKEKIVFVKTTI